MFYKLQVSGDRFTRQSPLVLMTVVSITPSLHLLSLLRQKLLCLLQCSVSTVLLVVTEETDAYSCYSCFVL